MATRRIVYPGEQVLAKPENWHQYQPYIFDMVRFHLYVEEYQAEDTTYPGEILGSFHTANHVEVTTTIEKEHTVVDVDETIGSQIQSQELASGVEGELLAGVEIPLYKVSAKVGGSIQSKLAQSFSLATKQSVSVTQRVTEKFEATQTITDGGGQSYHAVACYRPVRCDVYLHYLDYLFVEYQKTTFGLRRKKRNLPRPEGNLHVNRLRISQPLFTFVYWELLPKSSLMYSEAEYRGLEKKILTPEMIVVERLDKSINLALPPYPERPTLYTLANEAFPYRWEERKNDEAMGE